MEPFDYANIEDREAYDAINDKAWWFANPESQLLFGGGSRALVISCLAEIWQRALSPEARSRFFARIEVVLDQLDSGQIEIAVFRAGRLEPLASWLAHRPPSPSLRLHEWLQPPIPDVMHAFAVDPEVVIAEVLPLYHGEPGSWTPAARMREEFPRASREQQQVWARELALYFRHGIDFARGRGEPPDQAEVGALATLRRFQRFDLRYVLVERSSPAQTGAQRAWEEVLGLCAEVLRLYERACPHPHLLFRSAQLHETLSRRAMPGPLGDEIEGIVGPRFRLGLRSAPLGSVLGDIAEIERNGHEGWRPEDAAAIAGAARAADAALWSWHGQLW